MHDNFMRAGHRMRRAAVWALVMTFIAAGAASAKTYQDTRKRFTLTLPAKWKLTPMPGDTLGMTFKKTQGDHFALARIEVRPRVGGETIVKSLSAAVDPFRAEIGYQSDAEVPTSLGLYPAREQTLTVFASGDKRTVRWVRIVVMHAFGYVHTLHFETLDKNQKRFDRDFQKMMADYTPKAGKRVYAPLIARWSADDGGPPMDLDETNAFHLGPLEGKYTADGGKLTLFVPEGQETYRYKIEGRKLVLKSTNLAEPTHYTRNASSRFSAKEPVRQKVLPPERSDLVGRWRALDVASTDILVLHLAKTGSVAFGPMSGQWRFRRGLLTITSTAGRSVTYNVTLTRDKKKLILAGGDLDKDTFFEREDPR